MSVDSASSQVLCWLDDVLLDLDWDDVLGSWAQVEEILQRCGSPEVLGELCDRVGEDADLLAQCEAFNLFTKLVLYRHETGAKLRLHAFGTRVLEAHNHRAPFGAMVLHGSYTHVLYGAEEATRAIAGGLVPTPLFAQRQTPGVAYMISRDMVHATLADVGTVSVMLQGPTVDGEFHIINLTTGETRSRVGGRPVGDVQEPGEQRLHASDLAALRGRLDELGVTVGDRRRA